MKHDNATSEHHGKGHQHLISAGQIRAARALLGWDQRQLAQAAGISVPTVQRMEASDGTVRANVDTLEKVINALHSAGIELIGDGAASIGGGRGLRFTAASRR